MDDSESLRVVEALLFVSEEPLTAQRIAEVLECEKREATRLVEGLAEKFNSNGRAVSIEQIAGGWQLRTKTDLAPWIRKYLATRPVRLSRAALEVLAVVERERPQPGVVGSPGGGSVRPLEEAPVALRGLGEPQRRGRARRRRPADDPVIVD